MLLCFFLFFVCFFFNDTATTEIYTLSLHDALPIYWRHQKISGADGIGEARFRREYPLTVEEGFMEVVGSWFDQMYLNEVIATLRPPDMSKELRVYKDRKSTRLNSSHKPISYAVFCLKKKMKK